MPCGDGTGPLGLGPGVWHPGFLGPGRRGLCWPWYCPPVFPPAAWDASREEEKAFLRRRARFLEEELAAIKARLEELGPEKRPNE
ncbi:MAG: DUF5320 domain-containing protein [Bacillota bacterium]